jgi:hypothetical protein
VTRIDKAGRTKAAIAASPIARQAVVAIWLLAVIVAMAGWVYLLGSIAISALYLIIDAFT